VFKIREFNLEAQQQLDMKLSHSPQALETVSKLDFAVDFVGVISCDLVVGFLSER
jgi:hypothetical protein